MLFCWQYAPTFPLFFVICPLDIYINITQRYFQYQKTHKQFYLYNVVGSLKEESYFLSQKIIKVSIFIYIFKYIETISIIITTPLTPPPPPDLLPCHLYVLLKSTNLPPLAVKIKIMNKNIK